MTVKGLKGQDLTTVSAVVNHLVANQGVLFVKLHQYHWYVQGPHFYKLHEKFEQLYNEANEKFDEFAERLIALGEKPYSTLGEYLAYASISEKPYDQKVSAEDMVRHLAADYETIKALTLKGVKLAGEENDPITEDMLIGYAQSIDLTIWMFQAFLGNDAR